MVSFLMSLGFTKSKADSNLYFKVEDARSVMLLLYVDDLFLIGVDKLIINAKRNLANQFNDAIFLRHGGVAEYGWNLPWSRKVCSGDSEKTWNAGLQNDSHTYAIELEAAV